MLGVQDDLFKQLQRAPFSTTIVTENTIWVRVQAEPVKNNFLSEVKKE